MTDFKCAVDGEIFARVALAISTEETRYYLRGVHIRPGNDGTGAVLTATNGSFLVSAFDKDGYVEGEGIVQTTAAIDKALPVPPKANPSTKRVLVVGRTTLEETYRQFVVSCYGEPQAEMLRVLTAPNKDVEATNFKDVLVDGTFPDTSRIIPKGYVSDRPLPCLDMSKLATVIKAVCGKAKAPSVHFTLAPEKHESNPVLVFPGSKPEFPIFGLIMPLRADPVSTEVYWAIRPEKKEEEK